MSATIKTVGVCGAGGTMGAGIAIVAARSGFPVVCCDTAGKPLAKALNDTHFRARGLFNHVLLNENGARLPALPVPVAGEFRAPASAASAVPMLGANNSEFNV